MKQIEQLMQTDEWTDQNGRTQLLWDMRPAHRRNLMAWLVRNADRLERAYNLTLKRAVRQHGDFLSIGTKAMVSTGVEWYDSPEEWIRATPLYRKLAVITPKPTRSEAVVERVRRRSRWWKVERWWVRRKVRR